MRLSKSWGQITRTIEVSGKLALHIGRTLSQLDPGLFFLMLIDGFPGVGKTTLAFALGKKLRIPVLSKDTIRDTAAACGYDYEGLSDMAYETINALVAEQLRLGLSVIVDCSCTKLSRREQLVALADASEARFVHVVVQCQDRNETQRRLAGRDVPTHRVRDLARYDEVVSKFDEFDSSALIISSLLSVENMLNLVTRYLELEGIIQSRRD